MYRIVYTDMEFEWDKGNSGKNLKSHHISDEEAEEPFFDDLKHRYPDPTHSVDEPRYVVVGKTKLSRILFVVYTLRRNKIRIISARQADRKEKMLYEKTINIT